MNSIFARIVPFIFLGIMLVIFIVGIMIFSYLLILGAIVGFILFLIAWIKEKLFPSQHLTPYDKRQKSGRVIEHEDESK